MTIFYDATQLVHWRGQLTGIPRVMNELAIRFHGDQTVTTSFVSWVASKRKICTIDYDQSILHRGNGVVYRAGTVSNQAPYMVQPATSRVPRVDDPSWKAKATQHAARLSRRLAPGPTHRAQRLVENRAIKPEMVASPVPEDAVFVPWGEWWDPNFIACLQAWHRRGVAIFPVIHDMLPITNPHFSGHSTDSLTAFCHAILPISRNVFCVSESTRRDVVAWLTEQRLTVPATSTFRLGEDFRAAEPRQPALLPGVAGLLRSSGFILNVGTLEARKNHTLLYYIYKLGMVRGIDLPPLVIVGRRGWKTENIYDILTEDPQLKNKVFIFENVTDEELGWFYENCMFTVFPSFCEGWALPIAESLSRGAPCVTSNTTSMPEAGGDAAYYCSPFSADEYLDRISRLLDPDELAVARRRASGFKPASWDNSYRQVITAMLASTGTGRKLPVSTPPAIAEGRAPVDP